MITLSVVNSRSMQPTINPRDIILVEKISPVWKRDIFKLPLVAPGDIVFFSQPDTLRSYIKKSNLAPIRDGDLLVKRAKALQQEAPDEAGGEGASASNGLCIDVRGK